MLTAFKLAKKLSTPVAVLGSATAGSAVCHYFGREDVVPAPYGWAVALQLQQDPKLDVVTEHDNQNAKQKLK